MIGRQLGDFVLGLEIGRGGMGVVYEAEQISLHRIVALKVVVAGLGTSVERFRREAEAAAKLHHSNIVPVYATGEQDGIHFYAMEFIKGSSLDQVIRQLRASRDGKAPESIELGATTSPVVTQLPTLVARDESPSGLSTDSGYFDTVAKLIADVADALDHAHQHGVVHRDIKPSNLLLSRDGRLAVTDFGLARLLEQPGMTITGEFVGTPAYMSPEQITAGRVAVDRRTDVYSLGATLYELLTLQRSFQGQGREQLLGQILHKEPIRPRKVEKKIPVDLETICLKALEKDPDRRYQTARAMAEDLRRFVSRFAILAKRTGPIGRVVKWGKRHPAVAGLLACLVVAMATAGFFAYQAQSEENRRLEEQRQSALEKAKLEASRLDDQRQNAMDKAQLAAMSGDFEGAESALDDAERLGASTGQVRMLRGIVAYHGGKTDEATKHLKMAAQLMPESVAVSALLVCASDDWTQYHQNLERARKLAPKSSEDYLFLGRAEAFYDPDSALKLLEKALQKRPSPVVRLARAEVLASLAKDRGDYVLAEQAIKEAELVPDNPLALATAIDARTVALYAYRAAEMKPQIESAITLGRRDSAALRALSRNFALSMRWSFLRAIGEQDSLLDELETSNNKDRLDDIILTRYRRQEFEKALTYVRKEPDFLSTQGTTVYFAQLVLCEFSDGREEALKMQRDAAVHPSHGGWNRLSNQMIPLMFGKWKESQAACRELRRDGLKDVIKVKEMERALDYLCGDLTADAYLAAAGKSRVDQTNARLFIGLTHLSKGDRRAAQKQFQAAVDTGAFYFLHYELCWMLLGRLEQNPAWPPWAPLAPP